MKNTARFPILLTLSAALLIAPAAVLTSPTSVSAATAVSSPTSMTPAANLRITSAKVHGEHAYYVVIAMQKRYDRSADRTEALNALKANGDTLSGMIASTYGQDAGAKFKADWMAHIGNFMDYADASLSGDAAAKQKAVTGLRAYAKNSGKMMHAWNPYVSAAKLEKDLNTHIDLLLQSFDAYTTGKYGTAYSSAHKAYTHTTNIGASLATAITKQFPSTYKWTSTQTKAADFREQMDQALGEHTLLSMLLLEKGNDRKPDFANVKAALDMNTAAMTTTHEMLFGAGAAKTFNQQWNRHINDYIAYMRATLADNEAGRTAAKAELGDFVAKITAFQTGRLPMLDKTVTYQGNAMHGAHVITAFDSYHNGNYAKTYQAMRIGYNHMWMAGNMLSEAIIKKMPEKF